MTRPTVAALDRRVAQLEAGQGAGSLSPAEAAELARLEARYALFKAIDEMTDSEIDDYLDWHRSEDAARLSHLKERTLTDEDRRRSREQLAKMAAMTAAEIDAYLFSFTSVPPAEIKL